MNFAAERGAPAPSSSAAAAEPMAASAPSDAAFPAGMLYALALGAFAVGTEGFMIAAILPSVSQALHTSVQAAGQLVTIFALVYALSSPLLTAMTVHWPRRQLLLLSLAAFAVANLVAACASAYWELAGARVLLALAAGLFVPNANAVAAALVAPAFRGRALAVVNGGITVAVAVGVPSGAFIGSHLGWQATFVGVAILSCIALATLALRLPKTIASSPPASLKQRLAVIGLPGVLPTLLTTTLWATAAYTVYTYVSPFIITSTGLTADKLGFVLMVLGVAAIGGVAIGGYFHDRHGARRVQAISLPLMALAFASLSVMSRLFAPHALPMVVPLILLWGVSGWSFFPPQQARLIGVAGASHTALALSLNASFMYLGFSLGAALGSVVIGLSSVSWIGLAGAVGVLCAIAMSAYAWRACPQESRG